ncbi:MAG: winged helix-turn-helix transcriptional regulator [Candidatus Helarchaeota archaeon]
MKRNVLIIAILAIIIGSFIPQLLSISLGVLKTHIVKDNRSIEVLRNNINNQICMDASIEIDNNISPIQLNESILQGISIIVSIIIGINMANYPFFDEDQKRNLQLETRMNIFTLISENEGIHLREICRLLNKKMGVIQYHIQVLENSHLITSIKDGRYRRFFTNRTTLRNYSNKILVSFTRRETTSRLLKSIYRHNGTGIFHKELATEVGISSQAITWHIKKLINENIVRSERVGRQKKYFIVDEYLDPLRNLIEGN